MPMPFIVEFKIYEPGKIAPYLTTKDRKYAYAEFKDKQGKQGMAFTRMTYDITCQDLTKAEEYVFLVYGVMQAIRRFFDCGRREDDKKASLALEAQLDQWNARTRQYVNAHPGYKPPDEKAYQFFILVEAWRKKWHEYFRYKNRKDKDPLIEKQMKQCCFDYEKQINKYVKQTIGY